MEGELDSRDPARKDGRDEAVFKVLLDRTVMERAVRRMAHEMAERMGGEDRLILVGIQRSGLSLGRRLAVYLGETLGREVPTGDLEVGLYRDDLDGCGTRELMPTRLPVDIEGWTVVLVDDVLYTGRTIRSAMDALNHYGRPRRIRLAVLIDRGGRELPIMPDHVGRGIPTAADLRIRVCWRDDGAEDGVYLEPWKERGTT
jgi:pyrimidine operon attenuation protein/uracil phosphoribosyltransferase